MWLTNVLFGLPWPDQRHGFSLMEALRAEEEELGFDHSIAQAVVPKPPARKQVPVRETSPPLDLEHPIFGSPSGLTPSTPSSTVFPEGPNTLYNLRRPPLIRREAWPIQRYANNLEYTPERIYSTPWLRYMTQLSRDIQANIVVILTMILYVLLTFPVWFVWLYAKISVWVPPVGILVALADLITRGYVNM